MILLDTHVLIWWVSNPEKLTQKARKHIQTEKEQLLASTISIWEMYMLVKRKRLTLTMDVDRWIEQIMQFPHIRFVPIDTTIAAQSTKLPDIHKDPADRFILATALHVGASLITSDRRMHQYPHVHCIW